MLRHTCASVTGLDGGGFLRVYVPVAVVDDDDRPVDVPIVSVLVVVGRSVVSVYSVDASSAELDFLKIFFVLFLFSKM